MAAGSTTGIPRDGRLRGKERPTERKEEQDSTRRTASIYRHMRHRAGPQGIALALTPAEFRQLASDTIHGPCPYCNGRVTPATFSADHYRPVSRGGSWELWNVIGCCRRCNDCKGVMSAEEFMALLALTTPWPSDARQNLPARLRAGGRIMRR